MSVAALDPHGADVAVTAGRDREDIVVGGEIVRHRRSSRFIHFAVAFTFLVCLFTGLPIWTPFFTWMAALFGGLAFCRWLHPWSGALFAASSLAMFVHWAKQMEFLAGETKWLAPGRIFSYLEYKDDNREIGKYNPGQKLQFWCASLAALGLLASGIVMWFPETFPQLLREFSIILHSVTFILFVMLITWHVYLGTAAEPGTFHAITRGTVTKAWARLHHPKWYEQVTGQK